MPVLIGEKPLKREVKVYGIDGAIVLTISHEGIIAKAKGTKLEVSATWPELLSVCNVPEKAPSKYMGKALVFLKEQAEKRALRASKRLQKDIATEIAAAAKERVHG